MGNTSFTGEYRYSIDSKGRMNMPAKFRHALDETSEDTFMVTRGNTGNLVAYSLDRWRQVEENLRGLSSMKTRYRNFKRQVTRFATPCKFDGQGRIALPQGLLDFAGIEKEVVIIGIVDEIEIWDPLRLERYEAENQLDEEDIDELADEILG